MVLTTSQTGCKVLVMKKMIATAVAGFMLFGTLVGCASTESEDAGIDTGVVISKTRKSVTVLEDDGEKDKHRVSKSVARRCSVGERWPDCKKS